MKRNLTKDYVYTIRVDGDKKRVKIRTEMANESNTGALAQRFAIFHAIRTGHMIRLVKRLRLYLDQ